MPLLVFGKQDQEMRMSVFIKTEINTKEILSGLPDSEFLLWLKDPINLETGKPKLDINHPDKATRSRQIMGIINIWGFKYAESNKWDGGNIYDPKNGNTYSSIIKMENPNTLKVRGYVGISFIGRTDTWTRQADK